MKLSTLFISAVLVLGASVAAAQDRDVYRAPDQASTPTARKVFRMDFNPHINVNPTDTDADLAVPALRPRLNFTSVAREFRVPELEVRFNRELTRERR